MQQATRRDRSLCVVSNIPIERMGAQAVIDRYKALAAIETGFRVLKSELDSAPVYHRLPKRLKAHSAICFIALLLHRLMRRRLSMANSRFSVCGALEHLSRLQQHHVDINGIGYEGIG